MVQRTWSTAHGSQRDRMVLSVPQSPRWPETAPLRPRSVAVELRSDTSRLPVWARPEQVLLVSCPTLGLQNAYGFKGLSHSPSGAPVGAGAVP